MEENFFMLFGKFFVSNGCSYLNTSLDLKLNELIKKKSKLLFFSNSISNSHRVFDKIKSSFHKIQTNFPDAIDTLSIIFLPRPKFSLFFLNFIFKFLLYSKIISSILSSEQLSDMQTSNNILDIFLETKIEFKQFFKHFFLL